MSSLWPSEPIFGVLAYFRLTRARAEARDVLESIYGRFSEGFDTRYLKEAKAVLHQLK